MTKSIDYYLDRITMYRLVLYVLIMLVTISVILSFFSLTTFSPIEIIFSTVVLLTVCWLSNTIISKAYEAPTNVESVYITALILVLIVSPARTLDEFIFLGWVAILSMSSKYILAINKKHIFNPASIAVVISGLALGQSASWWVGTSWMTPFVLLGGYLVVRKLRYIDLVWSFFAVSITLSCGLSLYHGGDLITSITQIIFHSFLLFMGLFMVTEPMTLPPTKKLQMVYGAIVGLLSAPQIHIGNIYFDPELALCIGNVFAFIVSPKQKLVLFLQKKIPIADHIIDFVFIPNKKFVFKPGQYMEWTLPHPDSDARGNRRYFTLASSPTEDSIRLGIKFFENGSTYKKALIDMSSKTPIVGAQLSGEFTLPDDLRKKLVFIAGGIGITPYRSMIKYLIDRKQKRDIVIFYTNKKEDEIIYKEIFDQAEKDCGIKTVYTLTDTDSIPKNWQGKIGRINETIICETLPDYVDRNYYLSGPYAMICAFEKVLSGMGIKKDKIKKDFFPGLV
jgi:glycine betaine catabolism B